MTSRAWVVFWLASFAVFFLLLAWWIWHNPGGCINDC